MILKLLTIRKVKKLLKIKTSMVKLSLAILCKNSKRIIIVGSQFDNIVNHITMKKSH